MQRLEGKIAIVTGAGSQRRDGGNGKSAAYIYAREGAKVIALDRDLSAAKRTADAITSDGFECLALQADVSLSQDVWNVTEKVLNLFGHVDILHNNVGILERENLETTTEDSWDHVFSVNLKSVFLMCKAIAPIMGNQGSGSIINVSSIASVCDWGRAGLPGSSLSYAASKAALNRLTQSIALEFGDRGVRCNAIILGFVNSPLPAGQFNSSVTDERIDLTPMGWIGTGDDAANAALFFASDSSSYITGALLPVDGGALLKFST